MNTIVRVFASGLGTGYLPLASGTWGSALAAAIYWLLFPGTTPMFGLLTVAVCLAGVPLATAAEKLYGKKDDGRVVIDEVAGMWISLLFLPKSVVAFAGAFLFFRLFDVLKPLGIRRLQALPGGWGIMIDDVLAGILANLVMQAAVRLLPW